MFKQITKSEILKAQVLMLNGQSEMATHYLYKIFKSEQFQALVIMPIGLLEMETVNPLKKNSTFKVATQSVALLALVEMHNGQSEMVMAKKAKKDLLFKVLTQWVRILTTDQTTIFSTVITTKDFMLKTVVLQT